MVIDPVCGMELKPYIATAQLEYNGQLYYFCCQQCASAFRHAPEGYAASTEKETHGTVQAAAK
jgi:xanthine dehydrogenase accessory factor